MGYGPDGDTADTGSEAAQLRNQVRLLLSSPGLADAVARDLERQTPRTAVRSDDRACKPDALAQLARLALNTPLKRSPSPSV